MTAGEQLSSFEENGYYILENFMTQEEIDICEAEISRLHELGAELKENHDPAAQHFQLEPYAKTKEQDGLPVLRKIEQTRDVSNVFKSLSEHPKLIETVRALLGDDLLLFRSTLMLKPAHHGSAHAFHQDSAYWPMDPPALVTVSIALSDSTPENGCIQVIPESHKWGLQEWGRISRDDGEKMTDREDVDTSTAIEVPLKAGDALMFHSLVAHGSGPNKTSNARHTALYAYFPPTVNYLPRANAPREKVFPVVSGLGGRKEMTLVAAEVA
jgi:phytanoyl-CoA hydroxylase